MQMVYYWLFLLSSALIAGCWPRTLPPVAFIDKVAPIYPDARPENCKLTVLSAPPTEPYDIFAQIISYAGSVDMADKMQALIKQNACEAGADAIVLLPMRQGEHGNTDNTYPDWVLERGFGQGGRFPHWVDKRYNISQRAIALVFKRNSPTDNKSPGS